MSTLVRFLSLIVVCPECSMESVRLDQNTKLFPAGQRHEISEAKDIVNLILGSFFRFLGNTSCLLLFCEGCDCLRL